MDSDRAFLYPATVVGTPAVTIIAAQARFDADHFIVAGQPVTSEDGMFVPGRYDWGASSRFVLLEPDESERAFSREKTFFETLPLSELRGFSNQYVAIYGQRIVDADPDLYALTNRFFSRFGDVPVYVTFVGTKPQELIPSPIL